jgi:hypothetical protein
MFQHKSINIIQHAHKQNEERKSHAHLNRYRKILWQNSTSLLDKLFKKLGIEGMYPCIIKSVFYKTITSIILIGEKLKPFLLSQVWDTSTLSTFIQYSTWILRQRGEKARESSKRITNRKGRNQNIPVSRWYDSILKRPKRHHQKNSWIW